MASFSEHAAGRRFGRFARPRSVVAWLLLAALVSFSGCSGCNKTKEQIEKEKQLAKEKEEELEKEKERKKKEEQIKPFESGLPRVLPSNVLNNPGLCKPGHWICQSWPDVKANLGDFQGELQTDVVDINNRRVPLVDVPYEMTNQQAAALAKKQQKTLESFAWIPPRPVNQNGDKVPIARQVDIRLTTPGGGGTVIEQPINLMKSMPSYEYFFVVLSKGSRFDYLNKRLDSIRLHRRSGEGEDRSKFYDVVTILPNKRPTLPSNSLYWTSIAYLLWDDSDPSLWDIDQQQALVDWLHWGGQIIVSGPDALSQLQNSFLRPYLPATVEKATTFKADDLAEFQYWAGQLGQPPRLVHPWPGAVLKKDPAAESVANTGNDMVIERRVGHGRIVVTAFRITGPDFTSWDGCDSFFNACLMRRPARKFTQDQSTGAIHVEWIGKEEVKRTAAAPVKPSANSPDPAAPAIDGSDPAATADGSTAVQAPAADMPQVQSGPRPLRQNVPVTEAWTDRASFLDAKKCTSLRYFSRDAGQQRENYAADVIARASSNGIDMYGRQVYMPDDDQSLTGDDELDPPVDDKTSPGLGAWSDFGPVAQCARGALDNATGITVPDRRFILWVVVGYICVLVPLNWLLFRLINRVEWAWIAAPLIAIGCTVVVVRQAQLNIGFARSRNEIAVIEMQPGYSRAHMTRYTALYTSLATSYELEMADPASQIMPFPTRLDRKRKFGETNGEIVCHRGDDTRVTGLHINSNAADFVHSEAMADFGGTVTLHYDTSGGMHVTNGTKHPLENCRVVWNEDRAGDASIFTIARLDPGATARLEGSKSFNRITAAAAMKAVVQSLDVKYQYTPERKGDTNLGNPKSKEAEPTGELSADGIAQLALGLQDMRPGEVCLVAKVADEVPGFTITPDTRQVRQAALLVAHLDPGKLPEPERDEDHRQKGRLVPLPETPDEKIPELDPSTP